jgi:hypothetical protein
MARRARSALPIRWLLAAGATLLLLVAISGFFFGASNQPFRTAPEFPVGQYLDESPTLRGNTYRITGAVLNSIAWSPTKGRLISVQPVGTESAIPLVVPADINPPNIQKGQIFHFLVEVRDSGILYVTSLNKA